ncbi:AraC family transcriptional regulator [Massilia sp. BSC265]|uniref:AraC family transcriptional regulator n=1 Tax=Massilia sp. BSC265 TaxID=1549812 RepID=UPI00068F683B|nr:AraC family transcriptional regulator [Massilia sp. BSC265]
MTALRRPDEPTAASYGARIAQLVAALDPAGLPAQPLLDGVGLFEAASWNARAVCGAACIVILCGQARGTRHVDSASAVFQPCYRVQTALAPLEPLAWKPETGPAACLSVQLDLQVVAELILALDDAHPGPPPASSMQAWLPLDDHMADAVLRLLQVLSCAFDARVLGPGIARELLYRVLTGPQGASVRAALGHQGSMRRIGKALRRIREAYADAVDVAALANEAGMSIAAFHAHFKALTHTTPIQFLKTTRLKQARLLMMRDGVSAAHASQLVGYESNSQFSREFKRLFGRTPTQEAHRMKAALCPGETEQASHAVQPTPYKDFSFPAQPRPWLS